MRMISGGAGSREARGVCCAAIAPPTPWRRRLPDRSSGIGHPWDGGDGRPCAGDAGSSPASGTESARALVGVAIFPSQGRAAPPVSRRGPGAFLSE